MLRVVGIGHFLIYPVFPEMALDVSVHQSLLLFHQGWMFGSYYSSFCIFFYFNSMFFYSHIPAICISHLLISVAKYLRQSNCWKRIYYDYGGYSPKLTNSMDLSFRWRGHVTAGACGRAKRLTPGVKNQKKRGREQPYVFLRTYLQWTFHQAPITNNSTWWKQPNHCTRLRNLHYLWQQHHSYQMAW